MRNLSIAVLVSNLLILIGFGHGVAPIALVEFFMLYNLDDTVNAFNSTYNYETRLYISTFVFMIGQPMLFVSLFNNKRYLVFAALGFLWIGFIYLTFNIFKGDGLAALSLITGSPFILLSILLFIKAKKLNKVLADEID